MIGVFQARQLVEKHSPVFPPEKVELAEALGHRLEEEVRSLTDSPRFDNSAMDGFAVKSDDLKFANKSYPVTLKVLGIVAAGKIFTRTLKKGECCKIMTGAPLPKGADAVVAIEQAKEEKKKVWFKACVEKGKNIRRQGEELKKGDFLLDKGRQLNSRALALLAACGVGEVKVRPKPWVSVFSTGNELVEAGKKAGPAKIFDSNGPMLAVQVEEAGGILAEQGRLVDTKSKIEKILKGALTESDILVVAGGVSVGDYDYVKEIFKKLRVKDIFWRVAQKPGKPLYFGVKGKKLIFGLPGNPAAAWICFDEYVRPAIRQMQGLGSGRGWFLGHLAENISNRGNRDLFAKAVFTEKGLRLLGGQSSHMLQSLAEADVLMHLPAGTQHRQGEKVMVRRLKGGRGGKK